jgi:hypothetical protein
LYAPYLWFPSQFFPVVPAVLYHPSGLSLLAMPVTAVMTLGYLSIVFPTIFTQFPESIRYRLFLTALA